MPDASLLNERAAMAGAWYDANVEALRELVESLEAGLRAELREQVKGSKAVVAARLKDRASFVDKTIRVSDEDPDQFKYDAPMTQIHDIVGLRVIVPTPKELGVVREYLERAYEWAEPLSEHSQAGGADPSLPGYRSVHGIANLSEARATGHAEFQVRTILAHAWAEISHDLDYKWGGDTSSEVNRRIIGLAGIMELAEREFENVRARRHGLEGHIEGEVSADRLRTLAADLFWPDPEGEPAEIWYDLLFNRLSRRGVRQMKDITDRLEGHLISKARRLSPAIRVDFAWTTPAFLLDVWLGEAIQGLKRPTLPGIPAYDLAYFSTVKTPDEDADD